jgi:hypothetical protein
MKHMKEQPGFECNCLSLGDIQKGCTQLLLSRRDRFGRDLEKYLILRIPFRVCNYSNCTYSIGEWLAVHNEAYREHVLIYLPTGKHYVTIRTSHHISKQMASCHQRNWLYILRGFFFQRKCIVYRISSSSSSSSSSTTKVTAVGPYFRYDNIVNMMFDAFHDDRVYDVDDKDVITYHITQGNVVFKDAKEGKLVIGSSRQPYIQTFMQFFQCADLSRVLLTFFPEQYITPYV